MTIKKYGRGKEMTGIPLEKVEELLRQAGFSDKEIKRIELLSDNPIPVIRVTDYLFGEELGKIPEGKKAQDTIYQCLLFGRVLGVKRWVKVWTRNNAWQLRRFETAAYFKNSEDGWGKIIFVEKLGEDDPENRHPFFFNEISDPQELQEVERIARFIGLLI